MAIRSKRPCSKCKALTANKSGLCDTHQQDKQEERKVFDRQRGSSHSRGYDGRWKTARALHLLAHPLCVVCKDQGILTIANEVDHITPHRGDMTLFWNRDNWQSLCKPCHSMKTSREVR